MRRRAAALALVTLAACGDIDTPTEQAAPATPQAADPTAGHHQALDAAQAEHDRAVAERQQAERAARERAARATTTTRPPNVQVHVHPNPAPGIATASWYGPGFYGNRTACGQTYTDRIHGTAHKSLPCGTLVTFTNAGRSITVPVIDRGPFTPGRMWDLSYATCLALAHCYTGPIQWRLA